MNRLDYICEKCKRPIANRAGIVWLDLQDVSGYKADVRGWVKSGRVGPPPLKPRWMAHHSGCARTVGLHEPVRIVRVESIRNENGLTKETHVLIQAMGNDLALTDWLDFLRGVAYGGGREWFNGKAR